jgi:hypothetical protein
MQVNDYIILNYTFNKKVLAKVLVAGKKHKARLEPYNENDSAFEFDPKEVVANLGQAPNVGRVYGVQVEPLRERIETSFWGEIQIFHPLDDHKRKELRRAFGEAKKQLVDRMKMPTIPILTQVQTQTGRMLGCYKYRPRADLDTLVVKVDDDISDMMYKLTHEYAHGIWFRVMTPKQRMAWINAYHDSLELEELGTDDLDQLLEDVKSYGDLRGFAKANAEWAPALKAVVRHIKQTHRLDMKHLDLALALGDDIDRFWPSTIELSERQLILSDYARKSPEELFAETFSFKCKGTKLPNKLNELLDKTLRNLVKA